MYWSLGDSATRFQAPVRPAGGAGSAAIQLAKSIGARVFAAAGSAAKLELCRELGADVVIDYTEQDFSEIVMKETSDRGVDVVFDNVGEAVMEKSMASIAYNGRYLMMGFASGKTRADQPLVVPRRGSAGRSEARDRQAHRLRRDPRRDPGDVRPQDGRPHQRQALPSSTAPGLPERSRRSGRRAAACRHLPTRLNPLSLRIQRCWSAGRWSMSFWKSRGSARPSAWG